MISSSVNGFVQVFGAVLMIVTMTSGLGQKSNGLGEHIEWSTLEDGIKLAKETDKPLMIIIHKSWCGACKVIKPKFEASEEIAELSKKFVMVNTMDDDEPEGDVYQPDGSYIPRFLFFDPNGDLMKDIIHEGGNPEYKYYYNDPPSITRSMKKVLSLFSKDDEGNKSEEVVEEPSTKPESKNDTKDDRIEL